MTDELERLRAALTGRYEVERELGRGGMATVYLARDEKHERHVAIKVLRPDLAAALGPERFLREIKIAAALQHPHILPVHDSGEADGMLFYVMPFVEGESLRDRIHRRGEMPIRDAIRILHDVAEALAMAHERGIVHRDIKPDNVLLSGRNALVADFGVAKAVSEAAGTHDLTSAGIALGTPTYMAPEQAAADPVDHRADIYAFGILAYEVLAGEPPFVEDSAQAVIARHLGDEPTPLGDRRDTVPPQLEALVMKCLEKRAADRWQSASELVDRLEQLATPTTPVARRKTRARRRRPSRVWAAVVVGFLAVVTGVTAVQMNRDGDNAVPTTRSIAVLPLHNLTGDPGLEPVVAGLTDLLISQLTRIVWLDVKSYSSVLRYQNERPPIPEIGRELGVDFLIEGSVAKGEDEVRVNVQLLEAEADRHVWADDYRRPLADILGLQGEVTRAIASQVHVRLDPDILERVARASAADSQAIDAYIQGRRYHRLANVGLGGPEVRQTAVTHLRQAIARAPDWAAPYAELADIFHMLGPRDSTVAYSRAALALDPDEPLAHRALGLEALRALDWQGAEAGIGRAVEVDPNGNHEFYGVYLLAAARYAEAAAHFTRELERQPFRQVLPSYLAWAYVCGGEPTRAIEYLEEYFELEPQRGWAGVTRKVLGAAYLKRGEYERAIAEYEKAVALNPEGEAQARGYIGYVKVLMGRTDEARQILAELEDRAERAGREFVEVPELYLALGEPEVVLRRLETVLEADFKFPLAFLRCWWWQGIDLTEHPALRDNPRFQDLLRRIAFPN